MMPVIRPLSIPSCPKTEYKKEQETFAQMKVALHRRKGFAHHLRVLRAALPAKFRLAKRRATQRV